jgi:hypothetical protein
MRFSKTIDHSRAVDDWRDAYAKYDAFATAGDDISEEAKAASAAEYAALDALLLRPAATALEIREKLEIMRERGPLHPDNHCWHNLEEMLDRIQLDLTTIFRPNASPAMAMLFQEWAAARIANNAFDGGEGDADDGLVKAEDSAFESLITAPCTTPGDFIVKSYVDLIDSCGSPYESDWPFELNLEAGPPLDGNHDKLAFEARYRDIIETDLGRCMVALGRVDFDAEAWLKQAQREGKGVGVMLTDKGMFRDQETGGRAIYFTELGGPPESILDMLQCLTAGGLDAVSTARCAALADAIEENWPDLVHDAREKAAA